ncbi:hypothetical protein DXG03_006127 [Asterophora parasitica]|uniref:Uncharacterized protein n=1 Tax=Asterophora parasitica TaxID=117018 RepID=A0A9P7GJG3_9AGAR|nr:hypothetical protein DXG03_006127 [Asterophora parasitica]
MGQNFVTMVLELFQGVFGFIAANIVAIGVLGLGYHIYQQTVAKRGQKKGAVKM